jgi:hypothetical protein
MLVLNVRNLIEKLIIQRVNFTDSTQASRSLIDTDQSSQNIKKFGSAHSIYIRRIVGLLAIGQSKQSINGLINW